MREDAITVCALDVLLHAEAISLVCLSRAKIRRRQLMVYSCAQNGTLARPRTDQVVKFWLPSPPSSPPTDTLAPRRRQRS
jgi:hypothetical protein